MRPSAHCAARADSALRSRDHVQACRDVDAGRRDRRGRRSGSGAELLNDFLKKADHPKHTGEIVFQRRAPHCCGPRGVELMKKLEAHVLKHAPAGADLKRWRY
jgi:hypothetical protein